MISADIPGCIGNTIRLFSGEYFDFSDPNPELIRLPDIAHALGMTCRYGGHIPHFYSVAEHSLNAMSLACEDKCSPEQVLAVLLHDAAEAYVGDLVKPLKVMLSDFARIEEAVEAAIEQRFQISFKDHADLIKRYDLEMLKAEKIALFPNDQKEWFGLSGIANRNLQLSYLDPKSAADQFLASAHHALAASGRRHLTFTEAE